MITSPKPPAQPPTKNLLANNNDIPKRAYLRDIVIARQRDRCSQNPIPRIWLLIDTIGGSSRLIKLSIDHIKTFTQAFGDKLSHWFGKELEVCHEVSKPGKSCLRVYPIAD